MFNPTKLAAEFIGTMLLVVFAVGTATLMFGFKTYGVDIGGAVVATAMAFGLVLLVLCYVFGPVSGCHINPAVTMGFFASGRLKIGEAVGYWIAQFAGGIAGALILWGIYSAVPSYKRSMQGLGQDGFGSHSLVHLGMGGAFGLEIVATFFFVLVVLVATSKIGNAAVAGVAIGLALATVHLLCIPLDGTSVNPARALGPAVVVGHDALAQVWLFIVAPLVGGAVSALVYRLFVAGEPEEVAEGSLEPSQTEAAT